MRSWLEDFENVDYHPVGDATKCYKERTDNSFTYKYEFKDNFGNRKKDLLVNYQFQNEYDFVFFLDGDETIYLGELRDFLEDLPSLINFNGANIVGFPRHNTIRARGEEEFKTLLSLEATQLNPPTISNIYHHSTNTTPIVTGKPYNICTIEID